MIFYIQAVSRVVARVHGQYDRTKDSGLVIGPVRISGGLRGAIGQARRTACREVEAMGDIALASTVMEDIFCQLPGVEIDLDTPRRFEAFFVRDQRIHRTLGIDARRSAGIGPTQWVRVVERERYDAIIDLQSSDRSRMLMTVLTLLGRAAPVRIGDARQWPYNVAPPRQAGDVHALVQLQATIGNVLFVRKMAWVIR